MPVSYKPRKPLGARYGNSDVPPWPEGVSGYAGPGPYPGGGPYGYYRSNAASWAIGDIWHWLNKGLGWGELPFREAWQNTVDQAFGTARDAYQRPDPSGYVTPPTLRTYQPVSSYGRPADPVSSFLQVAQATFPPFPPRPAGYAQAVQPQATYYRPVTRVPGSVAARLKPYQVRYLGEMPAGSWDIGGGGGVRFTEQGKRYNPKEAEKIHNRSVSGRRRG